MKTPYKGHEIETDPSGNYLTIDGVDYLREWHNADVDDPVQFATKWIDLENKRTVHAHVDVPFNNFSEPVEGVTGQSIRYDYTQDITEWSEENDPDGHKIYAFAQAVAERACEELKLKGELFHNDSDGRGNFEFGVKTEPNPTQILVGLVYGGL